MHKHIQTFVIAFVLLLGLWLPGSPAAATEGKLREGIGADHAIIIEASTGEVIFEKNSRKKAYPASITKILTGILLLEHIGEEEVITASALSASQERSQWYFALEAGENIQRNEALEAMMVISSNDVAMAIVEHINGGSEGIQKLMTEKAREIGANDTVFSSPSGLHDPNHYTTAYDMAIITQHALRYPLLVKAMGTKEAVIETDRKTVEVKNPSRIHDLPYATGGKTGYTSVSQNTLVTIFEKSGMTFIAVVMETSRDQAYRDVELLSQMAFPLYKKASLLQKGQVVTSVEKGEDLIPLYAKEAVGVVEKKEDNTVYEVSYEVQADGDIVKDAEVGKMIITKEGELVEEVRVFAQKAAAEPTKKGIGVWGWILLLCCLLFLLGAGFFLWIAIESKWRRRRLRRLRR